jgi:SAM-dependent methyltransferase
MSVFDRAVGSLREYGVRRTAQSALSVIEDRIFELRYGTEILGAVNREELNPSSANQSEAEYYVPTRSRAFRRLLREFAVPRDRTFVDLGAGKGMVLLLAARYGFTRTVGVEFSPGLCRIAKANVVKFRRHLPPRSEIEIVCSDVVDYTIEDDQCIFFMFNPFGASVMQQVVKNIRTSLERTPRKIWIIYMHPKHRGVLEAGLGAVEVARCTYGPIESVLYSRES